MPPALRRAACASGLILALVLALGACDDELHTGDERDFTVEPPLDATVGPAPVAGRWYLTGQGRLGDCPRPQDDAQPVRIEGVPLHIDQIGEWLTLVTPAGANFQFSEGRVQGNQVRFLTRETLPDGDRLDLEFEGVVDRLGYINGPFQGVGPRGCENRGTFRVLVR